MREDATDWYLRARSDLLKSIADFNDYEDAVANFILASENLEHHGYELLQKSPEDIMCELIAKEELDAAKREQDALSEELKRFQELERLEGPKGPEEKDTRTDAERMAARGRERQLQSYLSLGRHAETIPSHHWRGRMRQADLHDYVSLWPESKPIEETMGSLYPNAHHFQEDFHPLRRKNVVTGLPAYIETLRDVYLPKAPGEKSYAERIKEHEKRYDLHLKDSPVIAGEKDALDGTVTHPHLGPHGDSHQYDLYLQALRDWKIANPERVKDIMAQFDTSEEQDFALAQAHMDDAIRGWMDTSIGPDGKRTSLGWGGFMHGLEWLSPSQREDAVQHLLEKGSMSPESQSGVHGVSAGRMKRDLAHRFSPEFFHRMRGQTFSAQNQRKHIESEADVPNKSALEPELLQQALHDTTVNGMTGYDALLNAFIEKHPSTTQLSHLRALGRPTALKDALKNTADPLAFMDASEDNYGISPATFNFLLGLKRDKNTGEPIFTGKGHFSEDEHGFSLDDVKRVYDAMYNGTTQIMADKSNRNADAWAHLGFNGPKEESIPEEESDLWMRTEHGPVGIGAAFHYPWMVGGHGRHPLSMLETLHDWMPKDEEGHSLIGQIVNGELMPNPKNIGLFGRWVPGVQTGLGSGGKHNDISLWGASGQSRGKTRNFNGRTRKQLIHLGHSTHSPGYANTHGSMDDDERQAAEADGGSWANHYLGKHEGVDYHNPLLSGADVARGDFRTANNARITHNISTRLGRLHAPEDPAPFRMLLHNEMTNPKHAQARTHQPNNTTLFSDFHGLSGKGMKELPTSLDDEEEMEILQDEVERLRETIAMYADAEEDMPPHLMEELKDAQFKLDDAREKRMVPKSGRPSMQKHKTHDAKVDADLKAITEMARRLKPLMEEADPTAFDPSNKMKFLANSARLMHDANRALLVLPHDAHGLTTHGYGVNTEERASASAAASTVTGNEFIPHKNMLMSVVKNGIPIDKEMDVADVMTALGFDHEEGSKGHKEHLAMAQQLLEAAAQSDKPIFAMTHGSLLSTGGSFHPTGQDISLPHGVHVNHHDALDEAYASDEGIQQYQQLERERKAGANVGGRGRQRDPAAVWLKSNYGGPLNIVPRLLAGPYASEAETYGLSRLAMPEIDERNKTKQSLKARLHDIIIANPSVVNPELIVNNHVDNDITEVNSSGYGQREIHPAHSLQGSTIGDYYVSGRMEHGWLQRPSVGIEFNGSEPVAGTNMPSEQTLHSVQRPILDELHGEDVVSQALANPGASEQSPNAIRPSILRGGEAEADDPHHVAKSLVALMNPDALLKSDGKNPPPVLAMHRIFSLSDLDALRGFSGEWAVSLLPDGERFIVRRKGGRISAYNTEGDVTLSDEDRKQFRALSDKNWLIDVVRDGSELLVVDILEYDDSNISDMVLRERMKVLRGQFDSHEHILVPGPHNFRLTDSEGLESAVKSLQESEDRILLRDATSTYMRGERRHPKWFLLRADKEVSLIVLDVRGKGPFTYRLGAGPLDGDGFGNRAVEHDGKTYLDVGTVSSPKPFVEGDVIDVRVSGVKARKRQGKEIYDVAAAKIAGESEDAPASLETLSLLTKSHPVIPIAFDLNVDNDRITLSFPEVDDVVYRMEHSVHGTWAHSPKSTLGELMKSDYPLLLAESLRPLWGQAASLVLKGVEATTGRSMSDEKDRERAEEDSGGVIEAESEDNVLKPKKMQAMVKTLSRMVDVLDRLEKEKMSGGPGARGLGIDVGSQIESPRGPTTLTTEQSLPDWDMRERPTEDPEDEYPNARSRRRKRENAEQSTAYEADSENL